MNLTAVPFTASSRRLRWANAHGQSRALFVVRVGRAYALQLSGYAMRTRRWTVLFEAEAMSQLRSITATWGGTWRKTHDAGHWDHLAGEWPGTWSFLAEAAYLDKHRPLPSGDTSRPATKRKARKAQRTGHLHQLQLLPEAVSL